MISTFVMVFLAELGDKTQLSTMMLAAQKRSMWSVFAGASLALCLTSFLGALVGDSLCRLVPPGVLRGVAGVGFILVGLLVLLGKL
ncbi:MAG: TMEM165/GDT1 family protein [Firmicutes bacterium]|nr:TMEM165/GDT1 family protein [Candidatus Fermentithermobacillaceae bacterium]